MNSVQFQKKVSHEHEEKKHTLRQKNGKENAVSEEKENANTCQRKTL